MDNKKDWSTWVITPEEWDICNRCKKPIKKGENEYWSHDKSDAEICGECYNKIV